MLTKQSLRPKNKSKISKPDRRSLCKNSIVILNLLEASLFTPNMCPKLLNIRLPLLSCATIGRIIANNDGLWFTNGLCLICKTYAEKYPFLSTKYAYMLRLFLPLSWGPASRAEISLFKIIDVPNKFTFNCKLTKGGIKKC